MSRGAGHLYVNLGRPKGTLGIGTCVEKRRTSQSVKVCGRISNQLSAISGQWLCSFTKVGNRILFGPPKCHDKNLPEGTKTNTPPDSAMIYHSAHTLPHIL